jgi:uncharacterized membrane protein YecN with MAPEG domain
MKTMGSITALYAGLTVLLFAGLSVYVSSLRGKYKTVLGDNSEPAVMRAVRAQGNCAEYIGILFLMLLLAEMSGGDSIALHVIGGTIFASRALHAYGVLGKRGLAHSIGATINYLVLFGLPAYVLYLRFT